MLNLTWEFLGHRGRCSNQLCGPCCCPFWPSPNKRTRPHLPFPVRCHHFRLAVPKFINNLVLDTSYGLRSTSNAAGVAIHHMCTQAALLPEPIDAVVGFALHSLGLHHLGLDHFTTFGEADACSVKATCWSYSAASSVRYAFQPF